MLRIVTIVGARPQFIKAAAVSRVLRATEQMEELLVHTGQHYDENMSEVFFQELEIPRPDYHLGVGSGPHGAQTGRMLEAIERVLLQERPDWVLVYGDTNSTLAGALAAVKLHIPIAHVEAGLRSFNRRMPEEINRVLTDHAADLLLVPTEAAVRNLRQEGIPEQRVHLVGDVMFDIALYYVARAEQESRILEKLHLQPKEYVLATIHRSENTDDPTRLRAILRGLIEVAAEVPVVLPVHPRTRNAVEREAILNEIPQHVQLIEPVGYLDMMMLEKNARLIVTDSGGVQKEAFFYQVPCVTVRDETEWVELVELGWNQLCPPEAFAALGRAILTLHAQHVPRTASYVYGKGDAAARIVSMLAKSTQ